VDTVSDTGYTPLHVAVVKCDVMTMEVLVDGGALVSIPEHSGGYTPLHSAASLGKLLKRNGQSSYVR